MNRNHLAQLASRLVSGELTMEQFLHHANGIAHVGEAQVDLDRHAALRLSRGGVCRGQNRGRNGKNLPCAPGSRRRCVGYSNVGRTGRGIASKFPADATTPSAERFAYPLTANNDCARIARQAG